MAEGERTEEATPRRKKEAREKGQVAKSMELNAAAGMLAGLLACRAFGPRYAADWQETTAAHIRQASVLTHMTPDTLAVVGRQSILEFFHLVLPVLLSCMVAGVASNVLQSGFMLTGQPLTPDFKRLNPFQGLARMFSQRAAMELAKSAAKASIVGYVIYQFFQQHVAEVVGITRQDVSTIGSSLFRICIDLLLRTTMALAVIAVADYAFQYWQFQKTLRMTKQEVREEYKRTEGDPLIKSRQRRQQRQYARKRMMTDVKRATVVITNPTHLAIALRYIPGEMTAPVVLAKGQALIAEKIKEIARANRVPIMENKPIAQALFKQCEIGDMIPVELYRSVAEVIAFVLRESGQAPALPTAPR